MKPVAFDYYRPDAVSDVVALLGDLREEASVLAGGMTLGPMLNMRLVRPRAVIDVSRMESLKSITVKGDVVVTGAGVVQAEAMRSDIVARELPLLAKGLPWVGHFQTRNRGTLGGSVAHADPSAEIPLSLVVCNGTVVLQSRKRVRRIAAREFFHGALATERRPDEMIVALEWSRMHADAGSAFSEIAQRHGDFAIASAACVVRLEKGGSVRSLALGLGGVESRPIAVDTAAFVGRPADQVAADLVNHVMRNVSPIEDHAATAEYRQALAAVLTEQVFRDAVADAARRKGRGS
jgi:CO/xanthine dehydrogenase FAD-binding subunit